MSVQPEKYNAKNDHTVRRKGARRAGPTFPGGPTLGDQFWESDTQILWVWNGTAWVAIGGNGIAPMGAWTPYVPVLGNVTLGNGTVGGQYTRIGRTIHAKAFLGAGTTTVTVGRPSIGLPVAMIGSGFFGGSRILDAGNVEYAAVARSSDFGPTQVMFMISGVGAPNGVYNGATPFAFGNGDVIEFSITYEAAS